MPKKLLIISEVFYPEEFLINDLVAEWQKRGATIEVLTKTPSYPFGNTYKGFKNKLYQRNFEKTIKVHRVAIVEGYKNSVFRKVANYLANAFLASLVAIRIGKRFDVVFNYQTGPLTFSLSAALIHKLYKKRTIIWTQDLWPDTVYSYGFKKTKFNQRILNFFVKFIYRHMDIALVTSRSFITSLKETTKSEKDFIYIPQWPLVNAKEKPTLSIPAGWDKNKFHFTFTGNIGKVQNLDNIIDGFGIVSKKYPGKIQLNIIGDGSHLDSLKEKVKRKHIEGVLFLGRKPLESMSGFYAFSDVLVISLKNDPSLNKYIPAKFQSYLTCGKPIFAAINGEVKHLVKDYNLGWTAHPDNIEEISDKFEQMYLSPADVLNNRGQNAKALLETQFNREKIIEQITSYILENNEK